MGYLVNFWSKVSEMLWAGSVEMRSTLSRILESSTARLQLEGGGVPQLRERVTHTSDVSDW